MANETAPRAQTPRAENKIPYGHPAAGVSFTKSELEELIRLREANVDQHGIRRVRFHKTDAVFDDVRLANYEALGYSIDDKGYFYELKIQQSEFKKREEARQAVDKKRGAPKASGKKDPELKDMSMDEDTTLRPVSAADLLGVPPSSEE